MVERVASFQVQGGELDWKRLVALLPRETAISQQELGRLSP
jgi:hypothetical protein